MTNSILSFVEETLGSMKEACKTWAYNLEELKNISPRQSIGSWTLFATGKVAEGHFVRITIGNLITTANSFDVAEKAQIYKFALEAKEQWEKYQEINREIAKLLETFKPT